ncbi:MAG: NAD(P)-dependent oxidoreductase [Syntrophales bacterium]|nr:NAD(P)-dependent oxidoreductase [Syntrophales bacterium]
MTQGDIIGFIGLGDMGAPMAERIVAAGFDLVVWNRTATKMQPLLRAGAKAAKSPAELGARADIICTCVDSLAAMETILFGPQGIVAGTPRTTLVMDHSTLPPLAAQTLGQRLRDVAGIGFIDVPVSGGAIGARAGTLAAMAGGEADLLERARPVIASFSNHITHMGSLGAGQATKACNQILNFGNMAALAEAVTLGKRFGINTGKLPEAISGGFADSNIIREFDRSTKAQDFSPIRFLVEALAQYYEGIYDPACRGRLDTLMKDLSIVLDMGRATDSPLPLITHFQHVFQLLHHQPEKSGNTNN